MTVKRFTIKEFSTLNGMFSLDVICDNGSELPSSTVCDLLNEQHEQIQEQKRQIKGFILMKNGLIDDCMKLSNENERLRKAVDNCQFRTLDLLDYIKEKKTVTHQEIKDWWNSKVIE